MSTSKKDNAQKFTREKLLSSKALSMYQPDFASVILTEPEYTIEEAKAAIEAALQKGV